MYKLTSFHFSLNSLGGLILDCTVSQYKGFAIYSPVINGVGGNLVAVQASRLSTSLHQGSSPGQSIRQEHQYHGVLATFCSGMYRTELNACWVLFCILGQQHSKTACLLVLMVIPGSLIFLCVIAALHGGHTSLTPIFIIFYELAAILQVDILCSGVKY